MIVHIEVFGADDGAMSATIEAAILRTAAALGPGLREMAYATFLAGDLAAHHHRIEREHIAPIVAGGRQCSFMRFDLVVDHSIVIEVKAKRGLAPEDRLQIQAYLRHAPALSFGVLVNFAQIGDTTPAKAWTLESNNKKE